MSAKDQKTATPTPAAAPSAASAPAAAAETRLGGTHRSKYATVVDIVAKGYTPTLAKLIQLAGLRETLQKNKVTVFVPSEAAFKRFFYKFPKAEAYLAANPGVLAEVLKGHVVQGGVPSSEVVKFPFGQAQIVPTLGSAGLAVINTGERFITAPGAKQKHVPGVQIRVNGSLVIMADFVAANGSVVHVVDEVLLSNALLGAVLSL
jgi:uncharacterized surface protein with fasciclin (FAS1) repeats